MQNYSNKDNININDDLDIVDLKKFFMSIWSRKELIIKIFAGTLIFFILMTFISAKKWKVSADLYINKSNSSNLLEINPYAIEEASAITSMLTATNPLANELELMQSPLIIDKVIKENNLRYKKLYNVIPTKKTGEYITTESFLKRKVFFDNKKGTHVVTITYTSKNKDEAYNVVTSIITNYIELHKELNSEKSKSDKQIIESEYNKVKADLNKKVNAANGLPSASLSGTGNLAAMSAFSRSAQNAMATLKGQYMADEKAKVEITEDASKVAQLSSKLEWAKLVEEMSDSSKVLIIKEPRQLRDWEYASPKLLINIILGIIVGFILSIVGVTYAEVSDKKLTYSMLGDKIIYNFEKEFKQLGAFLIANQNKKILFALLDDMPIDMVEKFKTFNNVSMIQAGISERFSSAIQNTEAVIMFSKIGKTNSDDYRIIKSMIKDMDKKIMYEVLI